MQLGVVRKLFNLMLVWGCAGSLNRQVQSQVLIKSFFNFIKSMKSADLQIVNLAAEI